MQGVEGAEGEAEGVTYVTREDGQVMKNKKVCLLHSTKIFY